MTTLVASGILIATGLLIAANGLTTPGGSPEPSAAEADRILDAELSLVPVAPATSAPPGARPSGAVATGSPVSARPTVVATPSAEPGVRAVRIRLERLGIDLPIVEGDGLDAPIGKAAHYPGSAWPGGGSNIYLYGHAREGMLLALWKVRAGDVVELALADGTTRRYVVETVLPKVPWDAVRYLEPTPAEQLTLQTSTSYHPTSPRFIAIAYPDP